MKVNPFTPTNVSRTVAKREAEKILRLLNTEFPSISSTQIEGFSNVKNNSVAQKFIKTVLDRITNLVRKPAWTIFHKNSETEFYDTLVTGVKKHKVANCADRSKLYYLLGEINGISTRNAQMIIEDEFGFYAGHIDHAIRFIPINGQQVQEGKLRDMKNLLIIDPWLGFADFAPKYEELISSSYNRFFGIPDKAKIHLDIYNPNDPYVSPNVVEFFKSKFPQFIINKK